MKIIDLAHMTPAKGSNRYQTRYIVAVRRKHNSGRNTITWLAIWGIFASSIFLTKAGLEQFSKTVFAHTEHIIIASPTPAVKIGIEKVKAEAPKLQEPSLPEPDNSWEGFCDKAKRLAPIYDFPSKVIIAQAALESQRGHSNFAINRNNFFGIAAYDWNPDNAYTFENQEQSIIEYMQLIMRNFPEAYAARNDPDQMIKLLENNDRGSQYATDPNYVWKLEHLPEWSQN